ncbi:putative zinc finger protein [Streptomyces sp. Amel2xB2]|nr:putative zinc finger protein [Streptomyces sp. Amel2xB2]
MSGTGMGGRAAQPERELTPAEQHLGDRLAALIDGELGHDARERVLAHLATCRSCKAEADAQRRVKNVFADTAPPPPSDGLLARLQGLPAGGPGAGSGPGSGGPYEGIPSVGERLGAPGIPSGTSGGSLPGPGAASTHAESGSVWVLDQLRGGRDASALTPSRGFRIHDMERFSSRGRRFAFAAAGAVSLAALALAGGMSTGGTGGGAPSAAKGDSGTASASSVRTAASGGGSSDRDRRRRDTSSERGEVSGTVLSASTTAEDSSGAELKAGRGTSVHRGAPWAAPAAPPAESEQTGAGHPLLREAFFASGGAGSTPPPALDSYAFGAEAYAGLPADAFPGGAIRTSEPALSRVAAAAQHRH